MTANLDKKATPTSWKRLLSPEELEATERAGHEPQTSPDELADREGYDPDFLDGWNIPLPLGPDDEMLKLRRGGTGVELKYHHFSSIVSVSRRMPMITAVNIDGTESKRGIPRISIWSFDGRLDKADQWGDALYDSNALDRGHMVRREDPLWGTVDEAKIANRDTFHFTNSCPQMAGVNQKTWLSLEDYVLSNARAEGLRVTVFTGPFFTDDDLEYRGAKVPLAFWKVVAIVTDDGRPSATAYKVDQEKALEELEFVYSGYKTYQISIQQVIDATGIDFSALVPYDAMSAIESTTGAKVVEPITGPESLRI